MAYRGKTENRLMIVEISGHDVGVYYRSPTPEEYIGYHTEKLVLKGRKVEHNLTRTNIKYALRVITDVRKGDLEIMENGKWIPFDTQSIPDDKWKEIMKSEFFELLDFVGAKIFNPIEEKSTGNESSSMSDFIDDQKKL